MGSNQYIYQGPYALFPKTREQQERPEKGCAKCQKYLAEGTLFCPKCGSPRGEFALKFQGVKVDTYEAQKAIGEKMCDVTDNSVELDKKFDLWIPNVDRKGLPKDTNLTDRDSGAYPMDLARPAAEIEALKIAFAKELAKLGEIYGVDPVFQWGHIVHWN